MIECCLASHANMPTCAGMGIPSDILDCLLTRRPEVSRGPDPEEGPGGGRCATRREIELLRNDNELVYTVAAVYKVDVDSVIQ